jgi:hypothetical protein
LPSADDRIGEGDLLVLAGLVEAVDGIEAL